MSANERNGEVLKIFFSSIEQKLVYVGRQSLRGEKVDRVSF